MSGGSLDYIYYKIEESGVEIINRAESPIQKVFGKHLILVAQATKALEWYYSGDSGIKEAEESIREVLGKESTIKELEIVREEAKNYISTLKEILERLDDGSK